ncbi:hypothetical protein SUDANB120_01048 [Streptomyces sp. enrichment culture]|uniref:DUF7848 domain-containing protein n=1 Tax=Streptomyces sp. enrichment culture TaxID=1795815 RepID=UPI003F55C410
MSTVLRFVQHRITRHPQAEITASAQCLDPDCGWSALPTGDVASVDVECMAHTGRTRHTTFARQYEDVALVERIGD